MTTQAKNIFNWATLPDNSGGAFFESSDVKASNELFGRTVGIMNDTASDIGFDGGFEVPRTYQSAASVIVGYTSTATSGDIHFGFDYFAASQGESVDPSSAQESASVLVTAPSGAMQLQYATFSITAANFTARDDVGYTFYRKGTSACDDMAAATIIRSLEFHYSDAP